MTLTPDELKRLLDDPRPILALAGVIMAAGSEKAFVDQRFGSFTWPERYQDLTEPFINIAGAVSDFESGKDRPLPRRFLRRPALIDTGTLANSITSEVLGDEEVEVGTTVEYANQHQLGGLSSILVCEAGKGRMADWLRTPEGEPYRVHLMALTQPTVTQLDTEVAQRPFVGITDEMETDIREMIVEEFSG